MFVTLSRESRKSETNWKIELANKTQQVSFDLLIHIYSIVIQFNCVRRNNALDKTDLLGSQGNSCCIIPLTANSKLPSPYLNKALIVIAFPCNKLAFLEIKSENRFSLICFLNIHFDSEVLHVFGECSILATFVWSPVFYGVVVIIVRTTLFYDLAFWLCKSLKKVHYLSMFLEKWYKVSKYKQCDGKRDIAWHNVTRKHYYH